MPGPARRRSSAGGPAEPEGLAHYFALDGTKRDLAIDLVAGKVGVYEGTAEEALPAGEDRRGVTLDGRTSIAFHDFPDYDLHDKPFSVTAWIKVRSRFSG